MLHQVTPEQLRSLDKDWSEKYAALRETVKLFRLTEAEKVTIVAGLQFYRELIYGANGCGAEAMQISSKDGSRLVPLTEGEMVALMYKVGGGDPE